MWQPLQDFAVDIQVKACDVASLEGVQQMAQSLDENFAVRPCLSKPCKIHELSLLSLLKPFKIQLKSFKIQSSNQDPTDSN